MKKFRHHSDGTWNGLDHAEILCCGGIASWRPIRRGDYIPANAIRAGETDTDGVTFVGRLVDGGEPGKINTADRKGEKYYNLWCYSSWSGQKEGQILVIESAQSAQPQDQSPAEPQQRVEPPQSQPQAATTTTTTAAVATAIAQAPLQPELPHRPAYQPESVPPCPTTFPQQLSAMSDGELEYLAANTGALHDWMANLPEVRSCTQRAEQMHGESVGMASDLIDKESQLASALSQHESTVQSFNQRQAAVQALLADRDRILQEQAPQRLSQVLQGRAQTSDANADQSLQKILEGSSALDGHGLADFRQAYLSQKIKKHVRLGLGEGLGRC